MTARLRAPGFPRAFLFLALGALLCAGIILGVRALYGFPISHAGGLTVPTQNGILIAVAADRADLLADRPRRLRLLVLLGVRAQDAA